MGMQVNLRIMVISCAFSDKMSSKRRHSTFTLPAAGPSTCGISSDTSPTKRQKVWDSYCWICHKSNTDLQCSKCIRSYHHHCLSSKDDDQRSVNFCCNVCKITVKASKQCAPK